MLSPACGFLEIIILTWEIVSESQLYLRSEHNSKQKDQENNNEPDLPGHQTSARVVLKLEMCVYFSGQTGSGR